MQTDVLARKTNHPHRTIIAIAFPAILANSSAPLVGLVDTWAIGHLADPAYLAAIGLGSVIFNFIFWAFGFLRMGTTGIIAQANGRNDTPQLVSGIWRSISLALALGIILLLLQDFILFLSIKALAPPDSVTQLTTEYFHIRIWAAPASLLVYAVSGVFFGLARTGLVLIQQLVLNIANAILNVTFVVVLGLGVAGVAWGTLIAQWLAAILGLWLLVQVVSFNTLLKGLKDAGTWLMSGFKDLILDGFAHATEALAGSAWGEGKASLFHRWVKLTGIWALAASLIYALGFWVGGTGLTALLTDLPSVRLAVDTLMPVIIALPIVAVACYQFDGVYIAATAGAAMMVTMAIAFVIYILVLNPMSARWGLEGLWGAILIFMAMRGISQAIWYPRLKSKLN